MGKSPVVIDNTNTQKWEFEPYINMVTIFAVNIVWSVIHCITIHHIYDLPHNDSPHVL